MAAQRFKSGHSTLLNVNLRLIKCLKAVHVERFNEVGSADHFGDICTRQKRKGNGFARVMRITARGAKALDRAVNEHRFIGHDIGVIGINLYSRFLTTTPPPARAQLRDVIAHIEHICTITGSKAPVALGSDAAGGFPATRLPEGLNQARDYPRLAEALCNANWNDKEIAGFCSENWLRFWRGA